MKNWILSLVLIALPAGAQVGAIQGSSFLGGTSAVVSGLSSTNKLQGIIPHATITVYLTGTTTLATIYSNGSGGALANPFKSNTLNSVNPGGWIFWAATNQGYDIYGSGGDAPNTYPAPVPLCIDCYVSSGGGGGGGGCSTGGIPTTNGSVTGDNTSTNCGYDNRTSDTATTPAYVSTFGYENLTANAATYAIGIGNQNSIGLSSTSEDVVAVGDQNIYNHVGSLAMTDVTTMGDSNFINNGAYATSPYADIVAIGIGNGSSWNAQTASDIVAIGDTTANAIDSRNTMSEMVCIGDASCTGGNEGDFENIVGIGFDAAQRIGSGNDIIGIGDLAVNNVGSNSANIIGIGQNVAGTLGTSSSDVIHIGRATADYGGTTLTDAISIGIGQNTASYQTRIGDSSITSLILYGCSAGEVVYDDGSGTCVTPGGGSVSGSGTVGKVPIWVTNTTTLGNSHLDELTSGVDTFSQSVAVDDTTHATTWAMTYNSGHAPAGVSGSAVLAPDSVGNFDVSENDGSFSRVCTAGNGVCAGGFTNPMTTAGDLIDATTGGAPQRLGIGTNGYVLTVVSGAPAWAASAAGATTPATSLVLQGNGSANGVVPATPAGMANTVIDSTGTSMYMVNPAPTVTGSVEYNFVMGTGGAGGNLAPGAANGGGQDDEIIGYQACPNATSMRESVCIGNQAGYSITGNGTGADDMIGIYIGSLAASHLTNLGGAVVSIGQKSLIQATALYGTTAVGTHVGVGVATDGSTTPGTGYSALFGEQVLDNGGASRFDTISHIAAFGGVAMGTVVPGSTLADDSCLGFECLDNMDGTSGGALENTAVGSLSGNRVTTGDNNFFGGYAAGGTEPGPNMTGSRNIILLNGAGGQLSSGYDNFLSDEGGGNLTTGYDNFMFGAALTGAGITTGHDNFIAGNDAGDGCAAQSYGIIMGYAAAYYECANGVVAVGGAAGREATGTQNTFLGYQASGEVSGPNGITSGSEDTFVGDTSGQSSTTESGLTEIGANADAAVGVQNAAEIGPGQNTQSNTIAFQGVSFFNSATGILLGAASNLAGGATGSAPYQSATNTTAFVSSPTTASHTFFYGWEPSGSAIAPQAYDFGVSASNWAANPSAIGTGTQQTAQFTTLTAITFKTTTNCSSSASPAVCGSASSGSVALPAAGGDQTLVVDTTAVTANSQIKLQEDLSLATLLGVTCDVSTLASPSALVVTARTAGASFTIEDYDDTTTTNPICVSYTITN